MNRQFRAVLFDMDGILYDSMPRHARAWMAMCRREGLQADPEDFFAMEGRTGAATIEILRSGTGTGRRSPLAREETERLYGIKSRIFKSFPPPPTIAGAPGCVAFAQSRGAATVLVTGSGQSSLLEKLNEDFPGAFPPECRVTAHDVTHGKPHPEPFLKGALKAGVTPEYCIAVDNAPLGVASAHAAGCFTIGVRTGPLPEGSLRSAGADIEVDSMNECTKLLAQLL